MPTSKTSKTRSKLVPPPSPERRLAIARLPELTPAQTEILDAELRRLALRVTGILGSLTADPLEET